MLNEMVEEGYIFINYIWKTERDEYPYSLTEKGNPKLKVLNSNTTIYRTWRCCIMLCSSYARTRCFIGNRWSNWINYECHRTSISANNWCLGSIANGCGAISTGVSLISLGGWAVVAGLGLIVIGAGTMAFGANEVVDAMTGTNYIQEWTGMSDTAYAWSYLGLNFASSVGQAVGNMYHLHATRKVRYDHSGVKVQGYRYFDRKGDPFFDFDYPHATIRYNHWHGWNGPGLTNRSEHDYWTLYFKYFRNQGEEIKNLHLFKPQKIFR